MFLDNLKISRKLALGFAAVVLTMAGMGGAMMINLHTLGYQHTRDHSAYDRQLGSCPYLAGVSANNQRGAGVNVCCLKLECPQ